ncbi:hypothetical protein PR048_027384 [Dryococelus australis]|uniref:Uncharacterized protein n=1 Tax=Dryococelus australis TaxID=614101 RepID=A0ABQ9GFB4_9NEOP|nr:hypothetical protein PR048_027384 [Dryococelus australis]
MGTCVMKYARPDGVQGHDGRVVRLLASHQGEQGSITGRFTLDFRKWELRRMMQLVGGFSLGSPISPVAPGFSHTVAGQQFFSGISRFSCSFISLLHHTWFSRPWMLRATQIPPPYNSTPQNNLRVLKAEVLSVSASMADQPNCVLGGSDLLSIATGATTRSTERSKLFREEGMRKESAMAIVKVLFSAFASNYFRKPWKTEIRMAELGIER